MLVSMGYQDVFVHIGDQVRVQAPNGRWVAPLVTGLSKFGSHIDYSMLMSMTGTFGSSDFIHSLLGGS